MKLVLSLGIFLALLYSCSQPDIDGKSVGDEAIEIPLSVGTQLFSRAPSGVVADTHSVNRILVLPFQMVNQALPTSDSTNFVPVWSSARQYDLNALPVNNLKIRLFPSNTYKIMILGYNRNDYDYKQPSVGTNRVYITNQPDPTTLANFRLFPRGANEVPEFFTCFCAVKRNGVAIGTAFQFNKDDTFVLEGELTRLVSGLIFTLTNIPSFITSVTLKAENMVKATRVIDRSVALVQTTGDSEERTIRTLIPVNGQVKFSEYLLPTNTTNPTLLYLDIALGSTVQTYTVTIAGAVLPADSRITLLPNEVVSITGRYDKINYGFVIDRNINLDDDQWDGLQ